MSKMIDERAYGYGYDAGYQDGREQGYREGWENASREYEPRLAKLNAEMRTMEARVAVLSRKLDNAS